MAGLLQLKDALAKKQGQQQARPNQAPNMQAPSDQLTPDEQAALESGLDAASAKLYEDKAVRDQIAAFIQKQPQHQSVGEAAAMLTVQADEAVEGALPETVVVPLGVQVLGLVADLGETLGFFKADEQFMTQANKTMMQRLLEEYGFNEDEARAMAASADEETNAAVQKIGGMNQPGVPA